jgi:hypothetical protein
MKKRLTPKTVTEQAKRAQEQIDQLRRLEASRVGKMCEAALLWFGE